MFADTPNYHGLGRSVVGREAAFRWHHGPMFFRGAARWFGQSLSTGVGFPTRPWSRAMSVWSSPWAGPRRNRSSPGSRRTAVLRSQRACTRHRWGPCRAGSRWWGYRILGAQLRNRQPRSRPTMCARSGTSGTGSWPTRLASSRHRRHAGSGSAVPVLLAGDTFPGLSVRTCPRLVWRETSSNRSDNQRAIRLFQRQGSTTQAARTSATRRWHREAIRVMPTIPVTCHMSRHARLHARLTSGRPPTSRGSWPVASRASGGPDFQPLASRRMRRSGDRVHLSQALPATQPVCPRRPGLS